ncbi:MAG: hypothetical protein C4335_05445 [Armatimonadota bacterium]
MDDVDKDLARVEERIAREEAKADAQAELKRWYGDLEIQAEAMLEDLEKRVRSTTAPTEGVASDANQQMPRQRKLERFEKLEIPPTDADKQTAPK